MSKRRHDHPRIPDVKCCLACHDDAISASNLLGGGSTGHYVFDGTNEHVRLGNDVGARRRHAMIREMLQR